MGGAQLTVRPRNRMLICDIFNNAISVANTGQAIQYGRGVLGGSIQAIMRFDFPVVIERIWINLNTNVLTGGSVNGFQLNSPINTPLGTNIVITNADDDYNLVEDVPIPAGQTFNVEWTSNSAGTAGLRGAGMIIRAVVLG